MARSSRRPVTEAASVPLKRSGLERNLPECSSAGARGGGAERRQISRKGAERTALPCTPEGFEARQRRIWDPGKACFDGKRTSSGATELSEPAREANGCAACEDEAEVEAVSRRRTAAGTAEARNEPEMIPRRGGAERR